MPVQAKPGVVASVNAPINAASATLRNMVDLLGKSCGIMGAPPQGRIKYAQKLRGGLRSNRQTLEDFSQFPRVQISFTLPVAMS
jgi:hypothetical protein